MTYYSHRKEILIVYFIFYFATLIYFALNQQLLSQSNPIFFTHNRDLLELLLISTGVPRFLINHPWLYKFADSLLISLPLLLIIFFIRYKRFSTILGILFIVIFGVYMLLQDILTQLHAEMLMGLFLMSFLFATNKEEKTSSILLLCRYFFLYLFVSAAIWKITRGTVFNSDQLSNVLLLQHSDLLTSNRYNTSFQVYHYLIDHPAVSYLIYIGAVVLEISFLIGFFSKKHDGLLLIAAIVFFSLDHLLMRLPYWPIMILGITLIPQGRLSHLLKRLLPIYK